MDIEKALEDFGELPNVTVNESFEELEKSILSLLSESNSSDLLIPCDSPLKSPEHTLKSWPCQQSIENSNNQNILTNIGNSPHKGIGKMKRHFSDSVAGKQTVPMESKKPKMMRIHSVESSPNSKLPAKFLMGGKHKENCPEFAIIDDLKRPLISNFENNLLSDAEVPFNLKNIVSKVSPTPLNMLNNQIVNSPEISKLLQKNITNKLPVKAEGPLNLFESVNNNSSFLATNSFFLSQNNDKSKNVSFNRPGIIFEENKIPNFSPIKSVVLKDNVEQSNPAHLIPVPCQTKKPSCALNDKSKIDTAVFPKTLALKSINTDYEDQSNNNGSLYKLTSTPCRRIPKTNSRRSRDFVEPSEIDENKNLDLECDILSNNEFSGSCHRTSESGITSKLNSHSSCDKSYLTVKSSELPLSQQNLRENEENEEDILTLYVEDDNLELTDQQETVILGDDDDDDVDCIVVDEYQVLDSNSDEFVSNPAPEFVASDMKFNSAETVNKSLDIWKRLKVKSPQAVLSAPKTNASKSIPFLENNMDSPPCPTKKEIKLNKNSKVWTSNTVLFPSESMSKATMTAKSDKPKVLRSSSKKISTKTSQSESCDILSSDKASKPCHSSLEMVVTSKQTLSDFSSNICCRTIEQTSDLPPSQLDLKKLGENEEDILSLCVSGKTSAKLKLIDEPEMIILDDDECVEEYVVINSDTYKSTTCQTINCISTNMKNNFGETSGKFSGSCKQLEIESSQGLFAPEKTKTCQSMRNDVQLMPYVTKKDVLVYENTPVSVKENIAKAIEAIKNDNMVQVSHSSKDEISVKSNENKSSDILFISVTNTAEPTQEREIAKQLSNSGEVSHDNFGGYHPDIPVSNSNAVKVILPFKSADPDENNDIDHPEWENVKKLETDEERYKDVQSRWKSKTVPNPNRDLTYHSFRKRRVMALNSGSSSDIKHGRKRGADRELNKSPVKRARTKTVPCTFLIDDHIKSLKQKRSNEVQAVKKDYTYQFQSLNTQVARAKSVLINTPSNKRYNFYDDYLIKNRLIDIEMEHEVARYSLQQKEEEEMRAMMSSCDSELSALQKARVEIETFCDFYKGLSRSCEGNNDPTVITETQMEELREIENVYKQFNVLYKNSG